MASWSQFAADDPRLAGAVRALMQQYGPGLGYLATVRPDGGPRVHPVSPVFALDGLFCFVVDSPKRRDLERDGRYALHSFPPEDSDDEAYVAGRAALVTDPTRVAAVADGLRAAPHVDWKLFELSVEAAMVARHGSGGATPLSAHPAGGRAEVQVWLDPAGARAVRPRVPRRPRHRRPTGNAGPVGGAGVTSGSLRLVTVPDTRSRR
jgi:pyridoxamine 5'-phosphate oxidase-like protein